GAAGADAAPSATTAGRGASARRAPAPDHAGSLLAALPPRAPAGRGAPVLLRGRGVHARPAAYRGSAGGGRSGRRESARRLRLRRSARRARHAAHRRGGGAAAARPLTVLPFPRRSTIPLRRGP